ncbi:MAG TPA: hypothetical protein VLM83_08320 [Anaerolineales bacterium]|nr:hypothetical protein [Anaerolineales bacterium]
MMKEKALTYEMVIAGIMQRTAGPLPVQALAEQMLLALPSSARKPQQAMRQHIREAVGRQLVFVDADTVLPLRLAYQGVRFRIVLQRESFDKGLLPLGHNLWQYLPRDFEFENLHFVDGSLHPITATIEQVTQKVQSPFGISDEVQSFANLSAWYRSQKMYVKDHLLVTILDWEQGILQLEREPFGQRNQALLAERNQLLINMFFDLLEGADREQVYIHVAVPTVYARMPDKSGYPPSHWMDVIAADERMAYDDWRIVYGDEPQTMFERLIGSNRKPKKPAAVPASSEQRQMVYRFKAHLVSRPKIWREIEIQGKQTLADLDIALRDAFNHDVFDHMGGFWKLIPRAAQAKTMSKRSSGRPARMREVEIGDVEPMGGGDGARIKVAELGLAIGEQIKYVYDFGDWIEHHLALQAIEAPQSNVKYPREVARNEPEYSYCVECQKKGKQEVATLICLHCSQEGDQLFLLCEQCAEEHDDHYIDELIY